MKTLWAIGKSDLPRNIIRNKMLPCNFQFCKKINQNILESKDNFCFTKNSLLNEKESPKCEEKTKPDAPENLIKIVVVDDKLTCEIQAPENINDINKGKTFRKDVMELTKFKLCVLNSIVALSTYSFYSTSAHTIIDFMLFTGGTMCISMTSQVLNQIKEKLIDQKMRRTCMRPLPKQRMTDNTALLIGSSLWVSSLVFYSLTCPHAILFSNLIVFLYIKAYTPMKRNSNTSMHIGALVGALPALLGSYAATGDIFLESAILLGGYIFAWQYPHFYGILYQNREDYKKAGFNFISNYEDKTFIAFYQMIAAMIAMLYIVYKLHSGKEKIINDICFIAFLGFYLKNFIPIFKFRSNPSKFAKSIRKESYMPFMIVLFSFIYSSIQQRRKNIKNII